VRTAAFLAGLAGVATAVCGSDGVYDDALLRAHMVQHLLLTMVASRRAAGLRPTGHAAAARGREPWHRRVIQLLRSRAVSAVTRPPFGVVLYSAVVLVTHLTPLLLAVGWPHDGEHLAYLVPGVPVLPSGYRLGAGPLVRQPHLAV